MDIFVSRANLVQSCLTHFERLPAEDLKKTFRIRFDGEVGVVTYGFIKWFYLYEGGGCITHVSSLSSLCILEYRN